MARKAKCFRCDKKGQVSPKWARICKISMKRIEVNQQGYEDTDVRKEELLLKAIKFKVFGVETTEIKVGYQMEYPVKWCSI